jgi:hypothetical protein
MLRTFYALADAVADKMSAGKRGAHGPVACGTTAEAVEAALGPFDTAMGVQEALATLWRQPDVVLRVHVEADADSACVDHVLFVANLRRQYVISLDSYIGHRGPTCMRHTTDWLRRVLALPLLTDDAVALTAEWRLLFSVPKVDPLTGPVRCVSVHVSRCGAQEAHTGRAS